MSDPKFHTRLESLRGLAALMVAYFHALAMVRTEGWFALKLKSVLNIAGNGTAGVTIFFVLSGYVLGRSLDFTRTAAPVAESVRFLVKRTFRIWPAMALCLLFCFLWVRFAFHPQTFDAASTDYYNYWRQGAGVASFVRDLLLQQTYLNPVTWTLQVEMIAGVLFAPLWWICRRSTAAAMVITAVWAAWFLFSGQPPRTAYMYMLLFGMHADAGARLVNRHLGDRALTICLALAFVGCGIETRWQRATLAGTAFLESVFAYLIVALLVASHDRVRLRLFDHPITRFLGSVSYSFYLWHFVVIYIAVTFAFGRTDPGVWLGWPNAMATLLFLVTTLVTLPIAWASHRFVELPMIALGKSIVGRVPRADRTSVRRRRGPQPGPRYDR